MPPLDASPLAASATNLLAARELMAFTLAFHIVLACIGVAMPAIVLTANWLGLRRGDQDAMRLARRWSKVMALTFAVGAVSGTVLSFEFGLLWPRFMARFGDAFGIAFGIEGIFFFTEAIFVAIYIYGWRRLRGWAHFWAGVPMVVAGIGGAFSVVAANSWMNAPQGFTLDRTGHVIETEPLRVLINPATGYEVPHMVLAAYMVTGFLVASVYAAGMLRGRRDHLHRLGVLIPLTLALIATPIQVVVGDTAAREIAHQQPAKFAATECITRSGAHQPERIGGICTASGVQGAISIPGLDSWLVGFSTGTRVTGLDAIPPQDRPPVNTLLHLSFDAMVGIGFALLALGVWLAATWARRRAMPRTPAFLAAVALTGPAAIAALWCGWIVTEVGRQPWIVQGYMLTSEAVTQAKGIWFAFGAVIAIYIGLGTGAILILRSMAQRWRLEGDEEPGGAVPYGPADEQAALP